MTTVNDFTDILRIIREQPEWGEALRAALLSREVLELPQQLAAYARATNSRLDTLESDVADLKAGQARLEAGQARLESDVSDLKAGQGRLETRVTRLEGHVGNLWGADYERRVGNNIGTILRRPLGLRRARLMKGPNATGLSSFEEMLDAALDQSAISDLERDEVTLSDLIVQGVLHANQSTVYVSIEISVTAGDRDMNRAANRAEILQRASGASCLAAVVCAHMDRDRELLAQRLNVNVILFGE